MSCTEDDLARVRQKRGELFARWEGVQAGDALELPFDPDDLETSSTTGAKKRETSTQRR
jgi:hypothetical protein